MGKMEQDLFAHLPSETIIDILSRLSVRCIATSKCVCKPWLDLLETDDFINSHFSKSSTAPAAAALAVSLPETRDSYPFKVFELDDDLESPNPITNFNFPRKAILDGSANDLIFLINYEISFDALYVCNPITREFIKLPLHEEFVDDDSSRFRRVAYGFGASKLSGEHKVVRLHSASDYCHVYTLGTGRWRRVGAASGSASSAGGGTFLNGFLYWKVSDSKYNTWVSCFDLETERFSTFSAPPVRGGSLHFDLVSLRDCLYAVDDTSTTNDEIVLWLLEECGAEKCWRVGYTIDQNPNNDVFGFDSFQPIKVFNNGDMLILCDEQTFLCYSIKAKTYQEIPSFGACGRRFVKSLLLTPSFRSLKRSLGMVENVVSF